MAERAFRKGPGTRITLKSEGRAFPQRMLPRNIMVDRPAGPRRKGTWSKFDTCPRVARWCSGTVSGAVRVNNCWRRGLATGGASWHRFSKWLTWDSSMMSFTPTPSRLDPGRNPPPFSRILDTPLATVHHIYVNKGWMQICKQCHGRDMHRHHHRHHRIHPSKTM